MSHNYGLRHHSVELSDAAMETEGNAVMSSPGPHSSPYLPSVDLGAPPHLSFAQLDPNLLDDDNDPAYRSSPPPVQYRTDEEKTIEILAALRGLSRFSLQKFLETVFTSEESTIKTSAATFYRDGGPFHNLWVRSHKRPRRR
jgi:hypothetical protein